MEIGISPAAANLWEAANPDEYASAAPYEADGFIWVQFLPDWAYDPSSGPWYIDDEGGIWSVSLRPSQQGEFIGNMI